MFLAETELLCYFIAYLSYIQVLWSSIASISLQLYLFSLLKNSLNHFSFPGIRIHLYLYIHSIPHFVWLEYIFIYISNNLVYSLLYNLLSQSKIFRHKYHYNLYSILFITMSNYSRPTKDSHAAHYNDRYIYNTNHGANNNSNLSSGSRDIKGYQIDERSLDNDDYALKQHPTPTVVVTGPEPPSRDLKDNTVDLENETESDGKGSLFSFAIFPSDIIYIIPSLMASCAAGVSQPVQTILMGKVFSALGKYSQGKYPSAADFMDDVVKYTMSMIGLSGFLMFCHWLMVSGWDYYASVQVKRAQNKVFHCFLGRDFAWYDTNKGIMGVLALLIRSFEEFRIASSMTFALNLKGIVCILSALFIAFLYSWSLTFICICSLPVILIFTIVTTKPMTQALVDYKAAVEEASTLIEWSLTSIQTVKQFNAQYIQLKKLDKMLDAAFVHYNTFVKYIGLQQSISRFVMLSIFVPAFIFGGHLVKKGTLKSGDVLTVFWSTLMLANSLSEVGLRMESFQRGVVASLNITEFLNIGMSPVTYFKSVIGIFPDKCQGAVSLKNVSIHFPIKSFYYLTDYRFTGPFHLSISPRCQNSQGSGFRCCCWPDCLCGW